MRTTVTIDDDLFQEAREITGESNVSALVAQALKDMITAESTRRLLALSGKAPGFSLPERSSRTRSSMVAEPPPAYGSDAE